MKLFVCVQHEGLPAIGGGVETYYFRMYRWAKSKGYKLMFFLREGAEIGKEWSNYMEELGISVIRYRNLGKKISTNNNVLDFKKCKLKDSVCITNSFTAFAAANNIFMNGKDEINILFYVLHPHSTKLCNKRIINDLWARPILRNIKDSNLVFMDEETRDYCGSYYPDIDFSGSKIVRLGMEIPSFDLGQRKEAYHKEKFTIVTIARFEFPFKGYLCGLVDAYAKLKRRFSNIELIIIGDGAGKNILEEKIKKLSSNGMSSGIRMLGYVPYGLIENYMKEANIFVGMGTTILDAAKYGVPSIVATAYQMNDYAAGFFSSDYTCIGKMIDEDGAKKFHLKELIEQVYAMPEEAYLKFSKKCYDALVQNYELEDIMHQLITANGKTHNIVPIGLYLFYDFMLPLWIRLHKTLIKDRRDKAQICR